MDLVQQCLNLTPVPCLGTAFGLLKSIYDVVQLVGSYKHQLTELARSVALLLFTLNEQYRSKEPTESSTWDALSDLGSLLSDILHLVEKQKRYGFFKLLFLKEDMQRAIDSYRQRITDAFRSFQISALLDIQTLQQQHTLARRDDQEQVLMRLQEIQTNQNLMRKELAGQHKDPMVTMAALQKRLNDRHGDERELSFFSRSLDYIKESTGCEVDYESWMITSLEVEFGRVLSKGGFGVIYQGKWQGADVALKVLKNKEGVTPHDKDLRNEIHTWSKLRHPNILQFMGASVLDDDPFIVMPLVKHGNVRDYLTRNPECDRPKIIHEISLGIHYLHSKRVVHGDLKAANVLIDDGEKPLLCDFGLSRIKENVDSRSSNQSTSSTLGSLNWMAPERFEGGSLRTPCDIYSFGMTMFEIHTNSTPFGGLLPSDFRHVVAVQNKRPEQPYDSEAPQLTEECWKLMTRCWAPEPSQRPKIDTVCGELAHMKVVSASRHSSASNSQNQSGMPYIAEHGSTAERPSRRQTADIPRSNQRPIPPRTQTHQPRSYAEHKPSFNPTYGTMPILEEPGEIDAPFIKPIRHPHNRQHNGISARYSKSQAQGDTQYHSPPSQSTMLPSHSTYPSPPHSAASYGPTTSYSPPSSYSPPAPVRNAYSDSNVPNTTAGLHDSFRPPETTYPSAPSRNYTFDVTRNPGGEYLPYSNGHYYGHSQNQAPSISQLRSLTLPAAYPYETERGRSPDPAFPQPYYHAN